MDTAHFTVLYEGADLRDGLMDVRDLAPSLLSMGKLFDEANRVINGSRTKVAVSVKAEFKRGSFGVDLFLNQEGLASLLNFFAGKQATGAANLITIVTCFVALVKFSRGRIPIEAKSIKPGTVRVTFEDGQSFETTEESFALFKDIPTRKELEKGIAPLRQKGIDTIRIEQPDEQAVAITQDEVEWFQPPELEDVTLDDQTSEKVFSIVSLTFKDDNKWRLSDGDASFWVTISDQAFLDNVNNNVLAFSKGDRLRVKLRTRQKETAAGELKTEYEALEILEHRTAIRTLPLSLIPPES